MSVSRWERDRGGISTLIDVRDLAEWEEIRPTDELYATTAADQRSFTLADGPTLSAVASFVGIAITRVEDVGPGTSCW